MGLHLCRQIVSCLWQFSTSMTTVRSSTTRPLSMLQLSTFSRWLSIKESIVSLRSIKIMAPTLLFRILFRVPHLHVRTVFQSMLHLAGFWRMHRQLMLVSFSLALWNRFTYFEVACRTIYHIKLGILMGSRPGKLIGMALTSLCRRKQCTRLWTCV